MSLQQEYLILGFDMNAPETELIKAEMNKQLSVNGVEPVVEILLIDDESTIQPREIEMYFGKIVAWDYLAAVVYNRPGDMALTMLSLEFAEHNPDCAVLYCSLRDDGTEAIKRKTVSPNESQRILNIKVSQEFDPGRIVKENIYPLFEHLLMSPIGTERMSWADLAKKQHAEYQEVCRNFKKAVRL
ncbi:MAG TPA: hypothetical protein VHQ41_01080 [Patescibacteria group bacterium]|jgi:hypothetical protein|nr:hypothetical protein [Patescibacteria group bacterium]